MATTAVGANLALRRFSIKLFPFHKEFTRVQGLQKATWTPGLSILMSGGTGSAPLSSLSTRRPAQGAEGAGRRLQHRRDSTVSGGLLLPPSDPSLSPTDLCCPLLTSFCCSPWGLRMDGAAYSILPFQALIANPRKALLWFCVFPPSPSTHLLPFPAP